MLDPIFVDLYPGDLHGNPDLLKLAQAGEPWDGVWVKTNQGLKYYDPAWFNKVWKLAHDAGDQTNRSGVSWFCGTYDYADLTADPRTECEFALRQVEQAGGFHLGDLNPCLDMEGNKNPDKPGRHRIEDWINGYAARMLEIHGRRPTLYGNIYLWENGVQGLCGCEDLIVAHYLPTLTKNVYERIGVPLTKLRGWQYFGTDGESKPPSGYPIRSPMTSERVDLSEMVCGLGYLVDHGYAPAIEAPPA